MVVSKAMPRKRFWKGILLKWGGRVDSALSAMPKCTAPPKVRPRRCRSSAPNFKAETPCNVIQLEKARATLLEATSSPSAICSRLRLKEHKRHAYQRAKQSIVRAEDSMAVSNYTDRVTQFAEDAFCTKMAKAKIALAELKHSRAVLVKARANSSQAQAIHDRHMELVYKRLDAAVRAKARVSS